MRRPLCLLFLIAASGIFTVQAQSKTSPKVISSLPSFDSTVRLDSLKRLVDLQGFIPGLREDIRYAGTNNFMHRKIYPFPRAFLRLPAARNLKAAEKVFESMGYRLLIFDAYRPYSATVLIYQFAPDPDYAAPPSTGSRHNRGCSVDCSLLDLKTGREIAMPTPFDSFTQAAHSDYAALDSLQIKNRTLLRSVMQAHGFIQLKTEWWHFDFADWKSYELLDLPFSSLQTVRE